jgi:hypothetical protein
MKKAQQEQPERENNAEKGKSFVIKFLNDVE